MFTVRPVSGAIVAFESVKFPGHYLSVGKDDLGKEGVGLGKGGLTKEGLMFSGYYLSKVKDSLAKEGALIKLEQESLESKNVQFTVRVNVSHLQE